MTLADACPGPTCHCHPHPNPHPHAHRHCHCHPHASCVAPGPAHISAHRAQLRKLQGDHDAHKAAADELQRGMDALTGTRSATAFEKEFADTVRRMAVVQVGLEP